MKKKDELKKKIILADSSSLVLSIIKKELEKEGFLVFTAKDGNEVLDKIKSENPVCVITNAKLPIIDGPSLCRIIKSGMLLKSICTIVFSIDTKWRKSSDFSYVDIEILVSENEVNELVLAAKNAINEMVVEDIKYANQKFIDTPNIAYVTKAMEQNLQNFYIMESLYKIGFNAKNIEDFSYGLINIVRDVFSVNAVVLILNTSPIQIYSIGIFDDEFGQSFFKVCVSDFMAQGENRNISKIQTKIFEEENKKNFQKENFTSYKYFPLIGDNLLGTIHLASFEKINLGKNIDETIQFFSEKASIFLSQAIYYKKASLVENRLRTAFSRFVPEEIIDELSEVGDADIGSSNEKRKVAVLISDIRNFTAISEVNQPEKVVSFLNGYFTRMVDVIKKYGGTIDKFMGDAVMALFGAPVSYEDNASRAVEAALEMVSLVPEISCDTLSFPEGTEFDIGIGIHYGEVIAGSIGCKEKTDYTVIGDTVNLASRLEGLTKSYGAEIIISGAVKHELENKFNLLHLDNVKVKGKSVGVEIYKVDTEPVSKEFEKCYTKALELYESGAWNLAKSYFDKAFAQNQKDKSSQMMAQRCENFIQNPPKNWDGAYSLTNK